MASEWVCSVCLATFSRPEHLRRHAAATHGKDRPHACSFCSSTFKRKDVLRRHERICKTRRSFETGENAELEIFGLPETGNSKRRRSSIGPDSLPCTMPTLSAEGINTEFDGIRSESKINLAIDFSDLDFLLLPPVTPDLLIAERLEHMAYFTSSMGMSAFADQGSFQWKQRMASHAYQEKILNPQRPDKRPQHSYDTSVDPLQDKSEELFESLQALIRDKKDDYVITFEWSFSINQLYRRFLSPSNIRRFLEYFWSLWYPHCPIVHKPLFDASSTSPELLCVMLVIGACLSPHEDDGQAAKKLLDSTEELVFRHQCFRDSTAAAGDTGLGEGVQSIQAAYVVCSLQKREGTAEAQARIRRYRHASMVTLARQIGVRMASHRNLGLEKATQSWWRQFAQEEELIRHDPPMGYEPDHKTNGHRSMIFVFLIDAALTIFHNAPPRTLVSELKMDVACPEACFQAETAEECLGGLRAWASTRFWRNRLSIISVVRRICQSPIEEALIQELSQLGTLNLFTMVQALHSLMFHLHNSLVFESTMMPVQTGLDNWRRIWNKRVPEDESLPEAPDNLWKQVGFLRHASEFWHLARIMAGKITSGNNDEDGFEGDEKLSRYDHTDMGDVNGLIMEYRRLNLGVS